MYNGQILPLPNVTEQFPLVRSRRLLLALVVALTLLTVVGSPISPSAPTVSVPVPKLPATRQSVETGLASYYADKYHGKRTASGEIFDMEKMTAAHRTLAFGTKVKVTRLDNGRSVVVRINDRGPFIAGRVIDVSLVAARELQLVRPGLAKVEVTVIE